MDTILEVAAVPQKNITIIRVIGRMHEPAAKELHGIIDGLLAKGSRRVVVDASRGEYSNCDGTVAFLLELYDARRRGCKAVLMGPTPRVQELCRWMGASNLFQVVDDFDAACAAFDGVGQRVEGPGAPANEASTQIPPGQGPRQEAIKRLWQEVSRCKARQEDATAKERLRVKPGFAVEGGEIISLDPGDSEEYSVTYWKFFFCSAVNGIEEAISAYYSPKNPKYQKADALEQQLRWFHDMLTAEAAALVDYQRRPSWQSVWSSLYADCGAMGKAVEAYLAAPQDTT